MPFNTTQHMFASENVNSSPKDFSQIGQVGDIGPMGSKVTMHPTDSHSTANGWGSQIAGLLRQKSFTIPVWFDPNDDKHTVEAAGGLWYMHENPKEGPWEFIEHPFDMPENATRFWAYIGEVSRPVPVDGVLMMQVTFEPTGEPTHIDATSLIVP